MLKKGDIVRDLKTGLDYEVTQPAVYPTVYADAVSLTSGEEVAIHKDLYMMQKQPTIIFEKLREDATIPSYAEPGAVGFDIFTPENVYIEPRQSKLVMTGIKANIPEGHWVEIKGKSGLSLKMNLDVAAGVLDHSFVGQWGVILRNQGDSPVNILAGKAIAQGVLQEFKRARIDEGIVNKQTERGDGAWGSTNQ